VDLSNAYKQVQVQEEGWTTKHAPFKLNNGYMPSMIHKIHSDNIIPKGIKEFTILLMPTTLIIDETTNQELFKETWYSYQQKISIYHLGVHVNFALSL
jgi:hypothetical protein